MDIKIDKILLALLLLNTFGWAEKSLEKYVQQEESKELSAKELKLKKIKEEMGLIEVESLRTDMDGTSLQNSQMSAKELKLKKIKEEMGIKEQTQREKEIEKIRRELKIGYEIPQRKGVYDSVKDTLGVGDSFDDAIDSVKDTFSLGGKKKKKKKSDDFSFGETLSDFYETVGLEEGENWGLPSVWGFNKKKKPRKFLGSKTLGATFLGDIQDSGSMIYSGMKNSGQSAEMMSGMMYNSSRMYNNMFGMFDESPLNIFEDEEEDSMFDFMERGNDLMEMFN